MSPPNSEQGKLRQRGPCSPVGGLAVHRWGSGGDPTKAMPPLVSPLCPLPGWVGGVTGIPRESPPLFNYSSCPNSTPWGASAPHPSCANLISLTSPHGSPKSPPWGRHPTAGGSRPWHRGVTPVTGGPATATGGSRQGRGGRQLGACPGLGRGPSGGVGTGVALTSRPVAAGLSGLGAPRHCAPEPPVSGGLGLGKEGVPGGFGEQGGWVCMLAASPPFPGPSCCGCSGLGLFAVQEEGWGFP